MRKWLPLMLIAGLVCLTAILEAKGFGAKSEQDIGQALQQLGGSSSGGAGANVTRLVTLIGLAIGIALIVHFAFRVMQQGFSGAMLAEALIGIGLAIGAKPLSNAIAWSGGSLFSYVSIIPHLGATGYLIYQIRRQIRQKKKS